MRWLMLALLSLLPVLVMGCGSDSISPDSISDTPDLPTGMEMTANLTDAQVFARAMATGTWVWYKFSSDTLSPGGNSPHVESLRTRYNPQAATQLDAAGKVVQSVAFPDSSLIVKEIYRNGNLVIVAVMLRAVGDQYAGHGDWLWGEYAADGSVIHSVTQSDATCHSCHVQGLDHTRMNDAHP